MKNIFLELVWGSLGVGESRNAPLKPSLLVIMSSTFAESGMSSLCLSCQSHGNWIAIRRSAPENPRGTQTCNILREYEEMLRRSRGHLEGLERRQIQASFFLVELQDADSCMSPAHGMPTQCTWNAHGTLLTMICQAGPRGLEIRPGKKLTLMLRSSCGSGLMSGSMWLEDTPWHSVGTKGNDTKSETWHVFSKQGLHSGCRCCGR